MPKVKCPMCSTIVTHADGYAPICPQCGFGRDAAHAVNPTHPSAGHVLTPPPGYAAAPSPAYGFSSPPTAVARPAGDANGLAIGALVCGIAGFMVFLCAPVAVVLGIMALSRDGDASARTMATVGIVLGALVTVGALLFFVFFVSLLA